MITVLDTGIGHFDWDALIARFEQRNQGVRADRTLARKRLRFFDVLWRRDNPDTGVTDEAGPGSRKPAAYPDHPVESVMTPAGRQQRNQQDRSDIDRENRVTGRRQRLVDKRSPRFDAHHDVCGAAHLPSDVATRAPFMRCEKNFMSSVAPIRSAAFLASTKNCFSL